MSLTPPFRKYFGAVLVPTLALGIWSCVRSQTAAKLPALPPLPLRTVIVGGGPTVEYNQYAIESNARYLELLTSTGHGQTILFADGSKKTRTVSTLQHPADYRERQILSWLLDQNPPQDTEVLKPTRLKKLDGPATRGPVLKALEQLSVRIKAGETGLVYFTGHGSRPGKGPGSPLNPSNSTYALWRSDDLGVPAVARALAKWPEKVPLTLVMVQCHSGGFADLLFKDAQPEAGVLNRDFAGFFAATPDRQSAGCTSEVDEVDYQDFTTHFFAALSGRTRYGTVLTGADYDHNGKVSMLEAYAWAIINDNSIDVPLSTSDAYLRFLNPKPDNSWLATPYTKVRDAAAPWQKAVFDGLSKKLRLSGNDRFNQAWEWHETVEARVESETGRNDIEGFDSDRVTAAFNSLSRRVVRAYPGLKQRRSSAAYRNAEPKALAWLKRQPAELKILTTAYKKYEEASYADEVKEAQLWRFLRLGRSVILEQKLKQSGTPEQKAIFERIRRAESRNPLAKG